MKRFTSILAAVLILLSVIRLVFANNIEKRESVNAVRINDVMDGYSDSKRAYIDLVEYPNQISSEDEDGGAYYIVSDDDYYYIAYMYVDDADMIEPDEDGYYHRSHIRNRTGSSGQACRRRLESRYHRKALRSPGSPAHGILQRLPEGRFPAGKRQALQ